MKKRDKGKGKRDKGLVHRFALSLFPFAFCLFPFLCALEAHDRITTRVTWDREIAPIFEARCADCHRPGGRSTIALATYQQARPWAVAIKEEVLARRMPKWNAARGFGAFANDPSLAPFEIALIAAWVDGGAPENEKNKVTAAPATPTIKPSVFTPPPDSTVRTVSAACGEQPVAGKLLAVRPTLDKNGSAGVAALFPNGRQEIIAWIRDYDPDYAATYWLRNALVLPRGTRLHIQSSGTCRVDLTFAR